MSMRLSGKEVSESLLSEAAKTAGMLGEVRPKLAIVRVGEKKSDLSYERGVRKKADAAQVEVETHVLPQDVREETLIETIHALNEDVRVDGILLFLPLPKHLDARRVINEIRPDKDMDGATDASKLTVYSGRGEGYAPCTPQAVMELLAYYQIPLKGKRVVIIGRSPVVGKPLALLMLAADATVTVCHTKTQHLSAVTKEADILVSAAGHIGTVTGTHVRPGQVVVDVGINFTETGKLAGDVCFDEVSEIADAVTPVPGGIGSVTSAVLLSRTVTHAEKRAAAAAEVSR